MVRRARSAGVGVSMSSVSCAPPGTGTSVPMTYIGPSSAGAVCGVLGDAHQAGGALGDDLVVEDGGVVGAGHAAVQVDLGVAGLDVGGDQHVGLVHCGAGGFALPAVGAEVVAAEDDAVAGELRAWSAMPSTRSRNSGGPQAGVAAELVDLVGGGLDQDVAAVGGGLGDGGLHHGGVGRADGVDADGLAGLVAADRVGEPVHALAGHLQHLSIMGSSLIVRNG